MITARRRLVAGAAVVLWFLLATRSANRADIYRWDTGELIPGTEGIEPGPGVQLDRMDLEFAKLSGMDLRGANFSGAMLRDARLVEANLADASLAEAKLTRAHLLEANLTDASLKRADLTDAGLVWSDLTDANLAGANLTGADLANTILTDANLTGAIVTWASFAEEVRNSLTNGQLYSTRSYQEKNLRGISIDNSLCGADFRGQDLAYANFLPTSLSSCIPHNISDATITGATLRVSKEEPLYSTASYKQKDLRGITLVSNNIGGWDFSGWDFSGQNLTGARFWDGEGLSFADVNFVGANLKNANLEIAIDLDAALFSTDTTYNQWTEFPTGFDPAAAGLTFAESPIGDLDATGLLDRNDVDWLAARLGQDYRYGRTSWVPGEAYDLNSDHVVDLKDHRFWVKDLKFTWYGDANLDGEFESGDLVQVFVIGEYMTGWIDSTGNIHSRASWAEGDWDSDGIFAGSDLETAFADGGYEQGPRTDAVAVPEPVAITLLLSAAAFLFFVCARTRRWLRLPPLLLLMALARTAAAPADIYRWDTGEVIPGTEDIEPGPAAQLDRMNLEWAELGGPSQNQGMDLTGAGFEASNLSNAMLQFSTLANVNLTGANLTSAKLASAALTNADLTDAVVAEASFSDTTSRGFTLEQLYATASYQSRDLQGIRLNETELTGWDLSGQDLTGAFFSESTFTNANLAGANLTDATLSGSTFTGTHLTGANLANADLRVEGLRSATFDATTIYNQWTVFPVRFDPVKAGLAIWLSPTGDFNSNGTLDDADIDVLAESVRSSVGGRYWWLRDMFDVDSDSIIDAEDHRVWIKNLKHTWFGDANLDGEFSSSDFVQVFVAGKYEKGWHDEHGRFSGESASWSEGDWNGDGLFDSNDMVTAFADGGYEQGLRMGAAVPEPIGMLPLAIGFALSLASRWSRTSFGGGTRQ